MQQRFWATGQDGNIAAHPTLLCAVGIWKGFIILFSIINPILLFQDLKIKNIPKVKIFSDKIRELNRLWVKSKKIKR